MEFYKLQIGQRFEFAGTSYVKKSSRTASILQFNGDNMLPSALWFYFGQSEKVKVI